MRVVTALLVALLVPAASALAEDAETGEFHRFHAAALFGESHNGNLNGVTFGGDLEVRLAKPVGVGLTGEHVNEPFRENVWVFPVIVHPAGGLKFVVGPGIERVHEEEAPHHTAQHPLLRVGVSYDIPVKHGWTIDPDVAVDFVDGQHVLVYAVAFGKEFGAVHKNRR